MAIMLRPDSFILAREGQKGLAIDNIIYGLAYSRLRQLAELNGFG